MRAPPEIICLRLYSVYGGSLGSAVRLREAGVGRIRITVTVGVRTRASAVLADGRIYGGATPAFAHESFCEAGTAARHD